MSEAIEPLLGEVAVPKPPSLSLLKRTKLWAKALKREVLALYYATHDARCPTVAKVLPFFAIAYALSPLDLIPDFIPILGLLDDVILLPCLIWLSLRFIPPHIMEEARLRADREPLRLAHCYPAAIAFFALWGATLAYIAFLVCHYAHVRDPRAPQGIWGATGVAVAIFAVWAVVSARRERRALEAAAAAREQQGGHAQGEEGLGAV